MRWIGRKVSVGFEWDSWLWGSRVVLMMIKDWVMKGCFGYEILFRLVHEGFLVQCQMHAFLIFSPRRNRVPGTYTHEWETTFSSIDEPSPNLRFSIAESLNEGSLVAWQIAR